MSDAHFLWTDKRLVRWLAEKRDNLHFTGRSRAPLRAIGEIWRGSVEDTFAAQGRPEKWEAWSESYAAWRAEKRPGKMLHLDTLLLHSIAISVGNMVVSIGSNLAYAARMQFGWPAGSADETPARPYIQPPFAEDWKEIEAILVEWAFGAGSS